LQRLEITADEVLREYRKLAFASLGDFLRVQPDGSVCFDLRVLTPDQAAIQEYSVDEFTEGNAGAKETARARRAAR
jgi:hypothetical protein